MRLCLRILIFTVCLAVVAQPGRPQQSGPPLTKDQVMDLVKYEMESSELAKRIKQRGLDFEPDDNYLEALRKAGGKDPVIQAIRDAKPKHQKPLTKEQVGKLVAGGVSSERAAALVKQRGIDFPADNPYLDTLRVAGASDTLIAALREATRALPAVGSVRDNRRDGLKYAWIPPGTFMMGCSPGDRWCESDGREKPSHPVTITRGFWLGQTPVTVGAYKRFVAASGRSMPPESSDPWKALNPGWSNDALPIMNVKWEEAHEYCVWAGGRLPTEAEWEYAARAGSTDALYGPLREIAWYRETSGRNEQDITGCTLHNVAQKRPNAFALYDMLGNVFEWVNDRYDSNLPFDYRNSPSQDPQGSASGDQHVIRGAEWKTDRDLVRVSARYSGGNDTGFRCAGEFGF